MALLSTAVITHAMRREDQAIEAVRLLIKSLREMAAELEAMIGPPRIQTPTNRRSKPWR